MRYIGSKLKLLPFIKETVKSVVGDDLKDKVFCDIFAGTGAVGRSFKKEVKTVISNDMQYYAYVLNAHYIGNNQKLDNVDYFVEKLNNLPLKAGFIYDNYCTGGGTERMYFSNDNGLKIDTIRTGIDVLCRKYGASTGLKYLLIASLLEAADKVANTTGLYAAYLKKMSKTGQKQLVFNAVDFDLTDNIHQVYNTDSNSLIDLISGDILYLDPPYNGRQYGSGYHLLNTIANPTYFLPAGKTGLPEFEISNYCKKSKAIIDLEDLIKKANFKYIFMSYSEDGIIKINDIKRVMKKYGKYSCAQQEHKRYQSKGDTKTTVFEYIHILEKW